VAASTAVPILYKPVRIADHDYIDGSVRGNASLDLAIEHGATLIICINPLVPFDNGDRMSIPFFGPDGGLLGDKGFTAVASQVARIQTHAGLLYHIKQLRKTHPEVDIVLVEPDGKDHEMSFYNIMRYSTRLTVARHGFETVTVKLAENYAYYADLLSRHGIVLNQRLVDAELTELKRSNYDSTVLRRILENSPAPRKQLALPAPASPDTADSSPVDHSPAASLKQLNQTLAKLDEAIAKLSEARPSPNGDGWKSTAD
jgi:predicted acylesterase/phospholipase RssA